MPIYGYRCESCGRDIDVVHAIAAPGPTTCEICDGSLRKTLSTPAIHFKGSGWAKKDASAGTSSGKAAAKADGEQAAGAAAPAAPAGDAPTPSGGGTKGDKGAAPAPATSGGSEKAAASTPPPASKRSPGFEARGGQGGSGRGGKPETQA
ncbi:zinc ribbon domain-containing protein [soil metagenome]